MRFLLWLGSLNSSDGMSDQKLPKQLLYGELKIGKRPQGRPRKRYKDEVSLSNFRLTDLREAGERSRWRTLLHKGPWIAEDDRSEEITENRIRRKNPDAARDRGHNCTDCRKRCMCICGWPSCSPSLEALTRCTFYFLRPGRTRPDLHLLIFAA